MDRAMQGGIDDVGLGVLFGLEGYRYELTGILKTLMPHVLKRNHFIADLLLRQLNTRNRLILLVVRTVCTAIHTEHLEAAQGVGPHTISVPRICPADDIDTADFSNTTPLP